MKKLSTMKTSLQEVLYDLKKEIITLRFKNGAKVILSALWRDLCYNILKANFFAVLQLHIMSDCGLFLGQTRRGKPC